MDGGICKHATVVDVRLRQLERRRDLPRVFLDRVLRHPGRALPAPDGSGRQAVGLELGRGEIRDEENPSIEEKFTKPPADATAPK